MTRLLAAAILLGLSPLARAWSPAKDCRANIAAAVCRVAALTDEQRNDPRTQRPCLGGEKPYVAEILKVHDDLPPKLQKMFCHLRRIYIEENYYATAYASRFPEVFRNKKNKEMLRFNGNVLGLSRQKIFESGYSLSEWLNRKEQTLFGRPMEASPSPLIPRLDMTFAGVKANPMLINVIVHEFGHLLDMAQRFIVTRMPDDLKCESEDARDLPECQPKLAGLWAAISWLPDGSLRPEDRYLGNFRPCYYNCEHSRHLPEEKAVELYRAFIETNAFVSTYASVNATEDFAESFLFYIGETYFNSAGGEKYFSTSVDFPGGNPVNLNSLKYKGSIRAKMDFMSMFDRMPWRYEPEPNPAYPLN